MLSKEKCVLAINTWKKNRTQFSYLKKKIDPTTVFHFSTSDCDWIKENNNHRTFHAYAGVYNEKFILIIIPLDSDGKEIDLEQYLTKSLTYLSKEIVLIETDVVTTVSKTTISKNLDVTKFQKEINLPTYNEPTITERASVNNIKKWKDECLDWFYYECKESEGQNVFRAFSIPFADLSVDGENQNEVIGLFGLKHSSIYNTLIPLLIFLKKSNELNALKIIRSNNNQNTSETNTLDWAHPCPPLCKDKLDFKLLDMDE